MDRKQHHLIERIKKTIAKYSMLSAGETVLVGLSGGPDSVCLILVLDEISDEFKLNLHALYVDHGLRPGETPAEIGFCRNLCALLSVPFIARSVDVKAYAEEQKLNKQEAARELRYRMFDEVFQEVQADKIALGHTADDQTETFLMRFLRGAGPKGLSGIPPVRHKIIRPLIEAGRSEIEAYLKERKTGSVTDSSNLGDDYFRNRVRFSLMPEMRMLSPHLPESISRMMDILREEETFFDILVTKTLMRLISRKSDARIELFLVPLETLETVLLRRVLRKALDETRGLRGIGFAHIEDMIGLIKKGRHGDRINLPKGIRVIKNYATLVITAETPGKVGAYTLPVPGDLVMPEIRAVITVSVPEAIETFDQGKNIAVIDADKVGTHLTVRSRLAGDFFYPLGFGKRKKLQDFFVDNKVSRDERDAVPLVLSGDDLVWVAGHRADERFRATGETKSFLRLEIKKGLP